MADLLVSAAAGAAGGVLVIVAERLLFSAEESWTQAQRSWTFVLDRIRERLGRPTPRCPECLATEPECVDFEVDPVQNPTTGEIVNGIPGLVYLCHQCGHTWRDLPRDPDW